MKKLLIALGITLIATAASAQEYIEPVEKWKVEVKAQEEEEQRLDEEMEK